MKRQMKIQAKLRDVVFIPETEWETSELRRLMSMVETDPNANVQMHIKVDPIATPYTNNVIQGTIEFRQLFMSGITKKENWEN